MQGGKMMAQSTSADERHAATRVAGVTLVIVPLLEIILMAHHPSVRMADPGKAVAALRAASALSGGVHGALIASTYAVLWAFCEFAARSGFHRPLIRFGLIAYGAAVIIMTGAALVSGFIVPRIAFLPADATLIVQLSAFAMLFNQAFARCATLLASAGIAAWSVTLWRGTWERALAVFGMALAAGTAVALVCGFLVLDVPGMSAVTALQAIWSVGIGILLLSGR